MLEYVSDFSSLLKLNSIPFYTYTTLCFFHLFITGHLGGFHILAVVIHAVMKIGAQTSV